MEVFTLIARKKNVALVFVSYLLVALAAISLLTICIGFVPGILFAVVFGIGGIVALVSNFIDMTSVINMINGLDNYSLIAIPIISVILLGISYLISNKIYQNKEF